MNLPTLLPRQKPASLAPDEVGELRVLLGEFTEERP